MRSSSKVLIGLGIAALAAFALEVASPYVAMHRLQTALLAGDEEEIRDRVDFVKVREAMREDAAARTLDASRQKAENGDAGAARAAGPAGSGTARLIDAYATPKGLAEIARTGKNPLAEERAAAFGYIARHSAAYAAAVAQEQARHPEAQSVESESESKTDALGFRSSIASSAQSVESESESKTDASGSAGPQGRGKNAPAPTWRLRWRKWSQCVVELRNPTEIGGLNLYMRRSGLFSWQVERLASVEKPKFPTEEDVLRALGCQCRESDEPDIKTIGLCRLPASYPPPEWDDDPRFRPGGLVRTFVLQAAEARTADSAKLLVLVASVAAGEGWSDFAKLGAVEYQLVGGQWKVEAVGLATLGDEDIREFRGEFEPVEVGRGRYGWTRELTSFGEGEFRVVDLHAIRGGRIQAVWNLVYQESGVGCGDPWDHSSPAKWRFDTASGGEFFDIIVEHGAETCTNSDTHEARTMSPPWTERFAFVGDSYKSMNPRLHPGPTNMGRPAERVARSLRALKVQTKDANPQEWAQTQRELGDALYWASLSARSGEESVRLLAAAADGYRRALEVWTKDAQPQKWAYAESCLGEVLWRLAVQAGGATPVWPFFRWNFPDPPRLTAEAGGASLARVFAEAARAFRCALEVWTKDAQPGDWATTQDYLGYALIGQAKQTGGAESARLFAEAADAYRHVLEVRVRDTAPGGWAWRQFHLGESLSCQAELTDGAESARALDEAVVAYRRALEVVREDYGGDPRNLALVQERLRRALSLQANQRPRKPSECAAAGAEQR